MTLKKMDLDKDGKVSFSDFESTVRVSLYKSSKFKRKNTCLCELGIFK